MLLVGVEDPSPTIEIARRLEHCSSVRAIAREAQEKGLRVQFVDGAILQDARVVPRGGNPRNFTLRGLQRALESLLPGDY
jgi:hypothetical protein